MAVFTGAADAAMTVADEDEEVRETGRRAVDTRDDAVEESETSVLRRDRGGWRGFLAGGAGGELDLSSLFMSPSEFGGCPRFGAVLALGGDGAPASSPPAMASS